MFQLFCLHVASQTSLPFYQEDKNQRLFFQLENINRGQTMLKSLLANVTINKDLKNTIPHRLLNYFKRECAGLYPHLGVVFYLMSEECVSVSLGQRESLTHSPRPWVRLYK